MIVVVGVVVVVDVRRRASSSAIVVRTATSSGSTATAGQYGRCSATCDGGTQTRERHLGASLAAETSAFAQLAAERAELQRHLVAANVLAAVGCVVAAGTLAGAWVRARPTGAE